MTLPTSADAHAHYTKCTAVVSIMLMETLLFGCAVMVDTDSNNLINGLAAHGNKNTNFCLDDSPTC